MRLKQLHDTPLLWNALSTPKKAKDENVRNRRGKIMRKLSTLTRLSAFALAVSWTGQAMAQTPAPQDASALDPTGDIIVTAQKRSERLQDVPVSISAFSATQLAGSGITNLTQIAPRVPGFFGGSAGEIGRASRRERGGQNV